MVTNENNSAGKKILIETEDDIPKLIEVLLAEKSSFTSWIQTKEAASWSALLFYFALLWSLNEIISNKITAIIILLIPPMLWYIIFRFIHAHYQQHYYTLARETAVRNIIIEIIEKKLKFFREMNIHNRVKLDEHITKKADEIFTKEFNNRGKYLPQPFKIIIRLWLTEVFNKEKKLKNNERQEAALLSLLTFSAILFELYLLKARF